MKTVDVMVEMNEYLENAILHTGKDIDEVWDEFNERFQEYDEVIVALAWDEVMRTMDELN